MPAKSGFKTGAGSSSPNLHHGTCRILYRIIELKSPSDNLNTLKHKMLRWMKNGADRAWLIDPANKQVFIYRKNQPTETVTGFKAPLCGDNILLGFELDLQILQ